MEETIAAVTTPPGEGAIAGIRISGPQAIQAAAAIFSGPVESYTTHTAHYGKILSKTGDTLDNVLLLVMRAPRSYTGEDTVEIFCHGGSLIKEKILQRIFETGVRPSLPGEFSKRAFLNGKLDLAQAEAVQLLIGAKNELALQAASLQLEGALSEKIKTLQKALTDWAAIIEASVDFPEEGLEFASLEETLLGLQSLHSQIQGLKDTFHEGKFLHEGLYLCLLGSPNVGKSSLMNALLGKERAIVTPIAGTTRDLIEEDLRFGHLHFRLIDTAGIRETEEIVEKEGIRRSQKAMEQADLILLLLDASRPLVQNDRDLMNRVPKHKTLYLWNKTDLAKPHEPIESAIEISAQKGLGLDQLKKAIELKIWEKGLPQKDEVILTQQRHYYALSRASDFCQNAINSLKQGVSPEFITSDLRAALNELGTIIGADVTEEILSSIFSKFCLGK